jgi:hypothetical protein
VLVGALVVIVALGAGLAYAIGRGSGHGSATTEVITTTTPASKAEKTPSQTTSREQLTAKTEATPPSRQSLQSYQGTNYSMMIPSGWVQDVDEKQLGEESESKWANPTNSSEYFLVDVHTPTHITMHEGAEPVHEKLVKEPGYTQVYYGPGDLSQHPESWMWLFEVEGSERIDYFFETCSNTVGALGSATPARFSELRGTFREVADSFRSSCE